MSDILFVCVHNAGRSQMAKALFNQMAKERGSAVKAESAGTEPAEHIHQNVVKAMKELGLDISTERPRLLTNEMVSIASRVITMGCAVDSSSCPAVFIKNIEDWGLPDPKGVSLERTRVIRDEVRRRVEELLVTLQTEA